MVHEMRVRREVLSAAMLEDEETFRSQERGTLTLKHEVGQPLYVGQGIWRIGEDEIEGLGSPPKKPEHISPQESHLLRGFERLEELADERAVLRIELNRCHMRASSRQQFQRYTTSACKEVESPWSIRLKVDIGTQHIKEVFLGEIRRGTSLERARHIKMPATVFACYYSHVFKLIFLG